MPPRLHLFLFPRRNRHRSQRSFFLLSSPKESSSSAARKKRTTLFPSTLPYFLFYYSVRSVQYLIFEGAKKERASTTERKKGQKQLPTICPQEKRRGRFTGTNKIFRDVNMFGDPVPSAGRCKPEVEPRHTTLTSATCYLIAQKYTSGVTKNGVLPISSVSPILLTSND